MPRRSGLAGGLLALGLAFAAGACGGSDDDSSAAPSPSSETSEAGSDGTTVTIKTFAFQPDPVEVEAGTTVAWNNSDQILHTITSGKRGAANGTFDHRLDGVGSTANVTFDAAGTFDYHCSIHPGMDATVVVS